MTKLTSDEQARTDGTTFSPSYIAPPDPIQSWRDGKLQPLEEPPKPQKWAGCSCATCNSGRNRAYAPFTLEIDALIAVLVHGSIEEKQALYKLLGIPE